MVDEVCGSEPRDQGNDNVGGVKTTTKPGLQKDELNNMGSEVVEGQCCGNLEKRRMMLLVNQRLNPMNAAHDRFVIDWNSVDLYPFIKLDQMRRGKESGLHSRRTAYRVNHSAN